MDDVQKFNNYTINCEYSVTANFYILLLNLLPLMGLSSH
jgi:hypothetical protein